MEPLLRGHPDQRPAPLESPLSTVILSISVLISNPDKRHPLLKGHISGAKGVPSQEGFHYILYIYGFLLLCCRYLRRGWSTTRRGFWSWSSCMRRSACVTAWWRWGPAAPASPSASRCWWRPWPSAARPTRRCAWTPKPSQRRRCSADSTWPPTTGRTASSLRSGGRRSRPRRCVSTSKGISFPNAWFNITYYVTPM